MTVLNLFAIGMTLGAIAVFLYPELMAGILEGYAANFGPDPALDWHLAWGIFRQNLTVSLMAWLGGIALGLVPGFIVLANGFILAYVCGYILARVTGLGEGLVLLLVGVLPHGIIEIPAFLAAAVLGLRLGLDWLEKDAQGHRLATLWMTAKSTARSFMLIILALAAAAVIEVFVSGKIVDKF